jgi:glycosyltransferase involved in cell wall biosynthesis
LIHCHQYSPFVYGRLAKGWSGRVKLVYTEHGRLSDAPPSWKRRLVNPLLARFDGSIVAVSDDLGGYMRDAGFPRSRVRVIRNGIDIGAPHGANARSDARARLGVDPQAFVIVTAARLDPVKDLHTLLESVAIARPHVPHLRLLMIGDGPERAALEQRAGRADLAGAVQFAGYRSDVRALLPAADIYANSSISEGVSVTILEAMAAMLPVIATSAGGNPEVVVDGSTGVVVPPRDPVRFAAALAVLARAPARRAAMALAGRRRLEEAFTIERMVTEYAELYRCLLTSAH